MEAAIKQFEDEDRNEIQVGIIEKDKITGKEREIDSDEIGMISDPDEAALWQEYYE